MNVDGPCTIYPVATATWAPIEADKGYDLLLDENGAAFAVDVRHLDADGRSYVTSRIPWSAIARIEAKRVGFFEETMPNPDIGRRLDREQWPRENAELIALNEAAADTLERDAQRIDALQAGVPPREVLDTALAELKRRGAERRAAEVADAAQVEQSSAEGTDETTEPGQ